MIRLFEIEITELSAGLLQFSERIGSTLSRLQIQSHACQHLKAEQSLHAHSDGERVSISVHHIMAEVR